MSGLKPELISETRAKAKAKQIPFGDDNQRTNGKNDDKCNGWA
jgi:hypothetical protein